MPISRIGKRKMIYGLLIKNFILLSLLVFLSLSLNLFCVHLMFRGGKYNPSEISALNVFTMFWTNHRAYSDHMYYLWHYGYVLLCNILLFPQPKNGIFCKYIFLADWNFKTWLPASHQLYCFFMQICYCKIKYIFWKILCCQLTIYTKGKPWLRVKKILYELWKIQFVKSPWKKQIQTVLALCMNPQNQSALGINLKINIIYIQIRKMEINYKKNIKYNFSYGIHDYFQ